MANTAITVKELAKYCKEVIEKGGGDRKILISADDEGNGYHELFFGFTGAKSLKDGMSFLPFGVDGEKADKEYIILG